MYRQTGSLITSNAGLGTAAVANVGTSSGNVMQVGAFGIGGSGQDALSHQSDREILQDFASRIGGLCTFREGSASKTSLGQYNPSIFYKVGDGNILFSVNYTSGILKILSATNTALADQDKTIPVNTIYGTANTTKSADGTLKAASPVVKLFHDGRSETNDESEGCTVTRLGVGQYLIKNCMGLNADAAWSGIDGGFDIPKDRNGQSLIWLDYEVNSDGSVLVKTYHRTYPEAPVFAQNNIEGIEAGAPVDIPADQFVSVRVEMPADSIWHHKMATMLADLIEAQNQTELIAIQKEE